MSDSIGLSTSPNPPRKGATMSGPQTPFASELHARKYRQKGETFRDASNRIAGALADDDLHFKRFRDILLDMRFSPAGRVQSAVGAPRTVTAFNCFVGGRIEDSMVEGPGSIMQRSVENVATMRLGGGMGHNFSNLRPDGSVIKKIQSTTFGPTSLMGIFDAGGKATSSTEQRRGAQMGVLSIDHPDILKFISMKQPDDKTWPLWEYVLGLKGEIDDGVWYQLFQGLQSTLRMTGFNISIGVTDKFMEHLATGEAFPLTFKGEVHEYIDPHDLWDKVMRSTWDWAEPGVLFIDRINQMNNLWYCEEIIATNPCGEQPLPEFGACLLGSFNLTRYLTQTASGWQFEWDQFREDVAPVHRAMDNVIDHTIYPLPQQEQEAKNKRRMGLGIMGLANAGEALGFPYGSPEFLTFEAKVLEVLRDETYLSSARLAKEKGAFPLFDSEKYMQGKFIETLPDYVKDELKDGARNSHNTSIAPTGTISLANDNVSSSIEPTFDYFQERTIDGSRVVKIEDYGHRVLSVKGKRAAYEGPDGKMKTDVTVDEHLGVLLTAQARVDSAVSKTLNMPDDVNWHDFKDVYKKAYDGGAKGCTTYRPGGYREGIIKSANQEAEGDVCYINPHTGERECG